MIERPAFSHPGDRAASFVMMHSMHTPWKTNEYPNLTGLVVPVALMLHRADGLIGFPGGMQDEGESPRTTAVREAYEELGVELDEGALVEHAALRETRGLIVRTFTYPATYQDLLDAQRNQQSGHHFGAEISGVILPHLVDYGDHGWEGGLLNILSSPAPETVPHEISILLQLLGYYGTNKIRQLSAQLGYKLAEVDPISI